MLTAYLGTVLFPFRLCWALAGPCYRRSIRPDSDAREKLFVLNGEQYTNWTQIESSHTIHFTYAGCMCRWGEGWA